MMKISIRTGLSTAAALIVVLSLAVGIAGLTALNRLSDGSKLLYTDVLPGLQEAEEMNVALGDLRIAGLEYAGRTNEAERKASRNDIVNARAAFKEWSDKYGRHMTAGAETDLLNRIVANFRRYDDMTTTVMSLADAGKSDAAHALLLGEMDEVYGPTGKLLDDLIDRNNHDADAVDAENAATFAATWWMVAGGVLALLLVGVAQALYSVFRVSARVRRISDVMSTVANGALDTTIPDMTSGDEIGHMAQALDRFRQGLAEAAHQRAEQASREAKERAAIAERARVAEDFSRRMETLADEFGRAAREVASSATNLSNAAEETSRQAQTVAGAAEEASRTDARSAR